MDLILHQLNGKGESPSVRTILTEGTESVGTSPDGSEAGIPKCVWQDILKGILWFFDISLIRSCRPNTFHLDCVRLKFTSTRGFVLR